MGRRRFEMFQYRAVLVRLPQGDSDRDIARARLMGRPKVAALRVLADRHGWLIAEAPLPEDAVIAAAIGQARRARSTISSVEPFRERVTRWARAGRERRGDPCRAVSRARPQRQLLGRAAHARGTEHRASAKSHGALAVRPGRSRAGPCPPVVPRTALIAAWPTRDRE
jgi:hypothetical protein